MRDTIDINSNDNALFITSQCNNRCVMCCQPPLLRNDHDGYFQKNMALIDSAPRELRSIGITGGEPTLLGDRLFELLRHIRTKLPETEIHLLTNGRAFADQRVCPKTRRMRRGKDTSRHSTSCRLCGRPRCYHAGQRLFRGNNARLV